MKILVVALVALIVFAAVFFGVFDYSVHIAQETTPLPQAAAPVAATPTSIPATVARPSLPENFLKINSPMPTATPPTKGMATSGFNGPTSQPHIIGPPGPPPNY
jgi:hypothetical protein